MLNLATALVGPLAGPECRRALGRGWLILVRVLAALALLGTLLIVLWLWWMYQQTDLDYRPYMSLRYGLMIAEGMLVTIALVLGPAVLAGSIAGEKERGVLALLLTTRVDAREIIAGRLAGKLTQVAMILLAGVPAVVALSALAGMGPGTLAILLGLPAAVALGGGGLAVLTSTVSKRGRDALLTVYLIDVLLLLSPLGAALGWSSAAASWLGTLNPFACLYALVRDEEASWSLASMGLWLALGMLSASVAAWRLRPACLRPLDGERVLRRGKRRGQVPPVEEERPMLWKELYIERAAALGGLGWWLGALLVVLLGGGSLILAVVFAWSALVLGIDPAWAQRVMRVAIGGSALFVGWLIQWGVGLRAAVTISSERERGTWDALLTSPLEGREIVRAKLWGSLHALRWLFIATAIAWTVAAAGEALPWDDYAEAVVSTVMLSAFMAAVGVRTSLSAATATRAMSLTIGIWLGAHVVVAVLAGIIIAASFLMVVSTLMLASGGTFAAPPWLRMIMNLAWPVTTNALYLAATVSLVADTRLRFDRIAGRMTAGRVATALDAVIHGRPKSPWRQRAKSRPAEQADDPQPPTIDPLPEDVVSETAG
jgi:ABC-type transport system involved in multi-copper enzyme maturation permease subunit